MKLAVSFIVLDDFTLLMGAMRSLVETTRRPCQVFVVVDNARGRDDPQIDHLLTEFPETEILISEQRKGFAANHNQVMRLVMADYVALLNDDLILHEAALDYLVDYLDAHPNVALVGPQQLNADGSFQVAVYSDPTLLRMAYKISGLATLTSETSRLRHLLQKSGLLRLLRVDSLHIQTKTRPVDIIKGAAMVVRRAAYEQVGLMDESTLAYGEEADWHYRLRKAGWGVVFVAEAVVTHFGHGQGDLRLSAKLLPEDRKSILNYFIKHRPRWQVWIIRGAIIASHGWWSLFWLPFSRNRSRAHRNVIAVGLRWQPDL
jgi:GT2 family glycosyltransferase